MIPCGWRPLGCLWRCRWGCRIWRGIFLSKGRLLAASLGTFRPALGHKSSWGGTLLIWVSSGATVSRQGPLELIARRGIWRARRRFSRRSSRTREVGNRLLRQTCPLVSSLLSRPRPRVVGPQGRAGGPFLQNNGVCVCGCVCVWSLSIQSTLRLAKNAVRRRQRL